MIRKECGRKSNYRMMCFQTICREQTVWFDAVTDVNNVREMRGERTMGSDVVAVGNVVRITVLYELYNLFRLSTEKIQ